MSSDEELQAIAAEVAVCAACKLQHSRKNTVPGEGPANAELMFIPELGGHVPLRNEYLETTVAGLYAVGDVSGIEEASTAIMEGRVAGISAAMTLGRTSTETTPILEETLKDLKELHSAPFREKIRNLSE